MREPENLTRSVLDSLSAHIAILDRDGIILAVNLAWRRFAEANQGAPDAVGEGANYLEVCDHAQGPDAASAHRFAEGARRVIRDELAEFRLEYPCHSPTEPRWFVVRVTPIAGDGPLRVVVAHETITEQRRAEEERAALERQLFEAQKMEALGRFAGDIAHDFNNIVAAILGYANLALDRCADAPQGKLAHYLNQVIAAGERARDLAAQMLAYGRGQDNPQATPQATPAAGAIRPEPVVREAAETASPQSGGAPRKRAGTPRIWVVDDEPMLADYLKELLEQHGYQVTAFTDPIAALESFVDDPAVVDGVLSDQNMPDLGGLDLAEALHERRPELPILLCSGRADAVDPRRAEVIGIRRVLAKPVDQAQLLAALREADLP